MPLSEHDRKLQVLGKFRECDLKLQPDKCRFLRTEASYLGHVITEKRVFPYSKKVVAIENYLKLTIEKPLNYLGMASHYRKFILNFSRIAAPLPTCLLNGPQNKS
jgi:hypothetical protein